MGENVWIVRRYSFQDCTKLSSVVFGSGLRHIGSSAFENCKSLTSVTLSSMAEKLYPKVFYGCKKLKTLTILTKKLNKTNVGDQAFSEIKSKAKVYCHPSMVKDYKTLLVSKGVPQTAVFKKIK